MANGDDFIDAMRAAMREVSERRMIDTIFGRPSLMAEMERSAPVFKPNPIRNAPETLFGIKFVPDPMFPVETHCATCGGSGEGGDEATYCPKCGGTGGDRIEGMVRNGAQTILMRSELPKKFAPHFPKDIPLPRRAATRSRTIPWPVEPRA